MIISADGKFIVRIKRSTFAKNPNAGRITDQVEGISNIQVTLLYGNGNLAEVLDKEYRLFGIFPILEMDEQTIKIDFTFPSSSFDFLKSKIEEHPEAKLELHCIKKMTDIMIVEHYPLPDYLFEYEKDTVQCRECNSVFSHYYLQSDCNDCGPIMRICPVCEEPNCCEVEYEDPKKVAKELGIECRT